MKKSILLLLLALFLSAVHAAEVTGPMALTVAEAWASENASAFGSMGIAKSAVPEKDKSGATLWWAVTMSGGGCVIVAPDTGIEPVITALRQWPGSIPNGHPLRALLTHDLKGRLALLRAEAASAATNMPSAAASPSLQSISSAAAGAADETVSPVTRIMARAESKWARLSSASLKNGMRSSVRGVDDEGGSQTIRDGDPAVVVRLIPGFEPNGPLTHWNQSTTRTDLVPDRGPLYNLYTPNHVVCGCTATACATILQTLNVTTAVKEAQIMCTLDGAPCPLRTKAGEYNWTILPREMGGEAEDFDGTLTDEQADLLGRATYNMGVWSEAAYSSSGTSAYAYDAVVAFREGFGFKDGRYAVAPDPSAYSGLIYAQNRCGAPVLLSIMGDAGGHAVVAVGYGEDAEKTAYTRIFMGWSGIADAWYALPLIDARVDSHGVATGYDFTVLQDVVTLLGTTTSTIPLYGRVVDPDGAGVAGATIEIPGARTNVTTDANGYWGIRVPPATALVSNIVYCAEQSHLLTIDPDALQTTGTVLINGAQRKYSFIANDLNAVLPGPMNFIQMPGGLVSTDSKDDAKRLAREQGKAIFMVSGTEGDDLTERLIAYVRNHGAELADDFVYCFIDAASAPEAYPDGNPSFGVFNPDVFDAAEPDQWAFYNGRLSYGTQTDLEEDDSETPIGSVIERGLARWRAWTSDITLTISENLPAGAEKLSPVCGCYTNRYGDGETVTAVAPAMVTNETSGVIYRCVGWSLTDDADDNNELDAGEGPSASFSVFSGAVWTLTWKWEAAEVKIIVKCQGSGTGRVVDASGVPVSSFWMPIGDAIGFTAVPNAPKYGTDNTFSEWTCYPAFPEITDVGGSSIFFTADQPITLTAYFNSVPAASIDPGTIATLTIKGQMDGMPIVGDSMPVPLVFGTTPLAYGSSTNLPAQPLSVILPVNTVTNVDGSIWDFRGWSVMVDGVERDSGIANASFPRVAFPELVPGSETQLTCLWARRTADLEFPLVWDEGLSNLVSGTQVLLPADELPQPFNLDDVHVSAPTGWLVTARIDTDTGNLVADLTLDEGALMPRPIEGRLSPITIVPSAGNKLEVRADIENGLRGFWYSIFVSPAVAGPYVCVAAEEVSAGTPAAQASETGPVAVSITFDPTENSGGDRLFYKVYVTERNPLAL